MPTTEVIPERLARRPRDWRGYPIPMTVLIDENGKPDFRVNDVERWLRVVTRRVCALCGEPLGRHVAFIGGPRAHVNRVFTDAGMHLDCARYALATCPYLALPRMHYANKLPQFEGYTTRVSAAVDTERPERFFIGVALDYDIVRVGDDVMVRARDWLSVEWSEL